ncbi:MAG: hypothetical protein JXR25_00955 [Pontiellaceae bacterium]|nr:hypothetical protein [Pontiellaceae bacterium]MBN2783368.1 hypothetical protein [Pontiellaceae bacterium]
MEFLHNLTPTATIVLIAAAIIVILAIFSKVIKWVLKLAIIAIMVLFVLYFLRQAGAF